MPPHDLVGERPEVLDRAETDLGELVLRRCGDDLELISDGMFLMDTRDGRSERAMVLRALELGPPRPRVVIGGLGFGFSLAAAVASPAPSAIVVVEIHRQVIEWNRRHLPQRTAECTADPRVRVERADIAEWLDRDDGPLDVLCLDTDNGPDWLTLPDNGEIYGRTRLHRLAGRLGQRGVVGFWSANRSPRFEAALREAFGDVSVHETPVARGEPDVVYFARHPRGGSESTSDYQGR